jgi:hypothetical protein
LLTKLQTFRCKVCECTKLDKRWRNPDLWRGRYYVCVLAHCAYIFTPVEPLFLPLHLWLYLRSKSVRFWRISGDKGDPEDEYPFVCYHQLPTGHWDNIFSAKMLPFSTRLCVEPLPLIHSWNHKLMNGYDRTGPPQPEMVWLRYSMSAQR